MEKFCWETLWLLRFVGTCVCKRISSSLNYINLCIFLLNFRLWVFESTINIASTSITTEFNDSYWFVVTKEWFNTILVEQWIKFYYIFIKNHKEVIQEAMEMKREELMKFLRPIRTHLFSYEDSSLKFWAHASASTEQEHKTLQTS